MIRIVAGMLVAAGAFPVVFLFVTIVGTIIIREAVYVSYHLLPGSTDLLYRIGKAAIVLNMVHAFICSLLSARKIFRSIVSA